MGSRDVVGGRFATRTGRIIALLVVAAILSVAGCGESSSSSGHAGTTSPSSQLDGLVRVHPFEVGSITVPEVDRVAPDKPFTLRATPGHLLFLYFGYTNCPDLCPTTLSDLHKALARLTPAQAARVEVAFMTVDPSRDTPGVLTPYLASFVKAGHVLRTTDPALLRQAESAVGASSQVVRHADGTEDVSHTAVSYIVDPAGRVILEWPFGVTPAVMAHDLRILLARPSAISPSTTVATR